MNLFPTTLSLRQTTSTATESGEIDMEELQAIQDLYNQCTQNGQPFCRTEEIDNNELNVRYYCCTEQEAQINGFDIGVTNSMQKIALLIIQGNTLFGTTSLLENTIQTLGNASLLENTIPLGTTSPLENTIPLGTTMLPLKIQSLLEIQCLV